MDQFKSFVFAEFLYFQDTTICLNAGYYTEAILFTIKFAQSFKDCYKYIFYTPFTIAYWWRSTAKWIDGCDNSNDEDVTVYTYNPVESALTDYWYGDGTKTGNCMPGQLSAYVSDLFTNVFSYAMEQMDPIDEFEY